MRDPYAHFNGNATAHQYPNDFGMPVILDEDGAVLHANFTKSGLPTHYQSTDGASAGTPYGSRFGNPWLFNGRAWGAELRLYHYRNRYLDPVQGRFTTRDPIGLWGDSMNLGNGYSYVGNNPWTYVDPFGLLTWQRIVDYAFGSVVDGGTLEGNIDANSLQYATPLQIWTSTTMQGNQGNLELGGDVVQFGVQVGIGLGIERGVGAAGDTALEVADDAGWLHWAGTPFRWVGRQCGRLWSGADEAGDSARLASQLSGFISYGELDELGRPTGIIARITEDMIGTGSSANGNIQPPGFITGALDSLRARGHLAGAQLAARCKSRLSPFFT